MTTSWFKPKRYGYGATPVTWQGWAVTAAAVVVIVAAAWLLPLADQSPMNWLLFLLVDGAVIVALVIVSRRNTAGPWRWRWRGQ